MTSSELYMWQVDSRLQHESTR